MIGKKYEVTVGIDGEYFKNVNERGNFIREEWRLDGVLDRPHGPAVVVTNTDNGEVVQEGWYSGGKLHRDPKNGPAWMLNKASLHQKWYVDGELHREDGPATFEKDNETGLVIEEGWVMRGTAHREGGAASIFRCEITGVMTQEYWRDHGKLSRKNGPAYIHRNQNTGVCEKERWYEGGTLHRLDGPAVVERNPDTGEIILEEYWRYGEKLDPSAPSLSLDFS